MPVIPKRIGQPKVDTVSTHQPYWKSECGRAVIWKGDCREVLKLFDVCSISSVVTDPPYGLEFMGKDWDAPWKNNGKIEICDEGTGVSHPFRDGTKHVVYGRGGEKGRNSKKFQDWFQTCAEAIMRVCKPGTHILGCCP